MFYIADNLIVQDKKNPLRVGGGKWSGCPLVALLVEREVDILHRPFPDRAVRVEHLDGDCGLLVGEHARNHLDVVALPREAERCDGATIVRQLGHETVGLGHACEQRRRRDIGVHGYSSIGEWDYYFIH